MLAAQKYRSQLREFTGPTPHSVAVRARQPSSRPSDYLIVEGRKREAARNQVLEFTKDCSTCDMKNCWEKKTEERIVSANVLRRAQATKEQHEKSINERRERLDEMLKSEERDLLQEMASRKETVVERQNRMRERAKYLQEKREHERKKVVAEKLDQHFREQSEELRTLQSVRLQDKVCRERAFQIQLRQEEQQLQQEEEMLFAKLWDEDRLAKEKRHNLETQRQREGNLQQLACHRMQMEAVEQQRIQAKRLKEEETQLLRDQREMMRLEKEREYMQKLQNQERQRRQLVHSLRVKMKRVAREQQDELAFDLSILEQLLRQNTDDKKEVALRKLELHDEHHAYQQYLEEQLEEEKRQEAEAEQMIESDLQQIWTRRAEQARLKKEARNRLMRDVMDTRRLQIQEKLGWNAQKQAELAEEREQLKRNIQENKLLDEQEKTRIRNACEEYRSDLMAQMLHKQHLFNEEQAEKELEFEQDLIKQEQYNQKTQEILANTAFTIAVHPFRR